MAACARHSQPFFGDFCGLPVANFLNYGAMNSLVRILCSLSLLFLVACNVPFFGNEDPVIVSVGSTKLTQSLVHKYVPQWDSLDDRAKLAFLEHWMEEEVIYQEAMDAKITNDTILATQIESTVRKMIVDYYLQTFADTMMVGDAEKLAYYQAHQDSYLRGKTTISGAVLSFKSWANADAYYREMKSRAFNKVPAEHPLVAEILPFDSMDVSPDTCLIHDILTFPVGKLSAMRYCKGGLKMAVVTERLDSAEVRPYVEVAEDVSNLVWLEHKKMVMERLKKEWKMKRPIFSKSPVFTEKEN